MKVKKVGLQEGLLKEFFFPFQKPLYIKKEHLFSGIFLLRRQHFLWDFLFYSEVF